MTCKRAGRADAGDAAEGRKRPGSRLHPGWGRPLEGKKGEYGAMRKMACVLAVLCCLALGAAAQEKSVPRAVSSAIPGSSSQSVYTRS